MTMLLAVFVLAAQGNNAQPPRNDCPMHAQHMAAQQQASTANHDPDHDFAAMQRRGQMAMGFDQEKTTHHFVLAEDGGRIVVEANSPDDGANITNIRQHLQHIAEAFASGDFSIPMQVHEQKPPGTEAMQQLKGQIVYRYHELPHGGAVLISSHDAKAIQAIHDFLSFQITEHRTGNAETMKH